MSAAMLTRLYQLEISVEGIELTTAACFLERLVRQSQIDFGEVKLNQPFFESNLSVEKKAEMTPSASFQAPRLSMLGQGSPTLLGPGNRLAANKIPLLMVKGRYCNTSSTSGRGNAI